MAIVIVKITETLERTVTVHDISSIHEALESIQGKYKKTDIVLDSSDFVGVTFSAEVIKEAEIKCPA